MRVLEILTGGSEDRALACLERPLARLAEHGAGAGFAGFLDAVRRDIVPLLLGR